MKTCSLFKTAAAASAVTVMAGSGAMLANSFKSRREMQEYLWGLVADARRYCSTDMTMVITEVCGDQPNKVFQDAKVYISKHVSTRMSSSIRVFKHEKDVNLTFTVEEEDNVFTHTFQGVELRWVLRCHQIDRTKFRYYELTFPKKAKEMVIRSYLPFVSREAARQRVKTRKLFYIDGAEKWTSVTFNHPSTWIALWRKGVELRWILRCHQIDGTKFRYYELTFSKKAKKMVTRSYLPFVSREAARRRVKTRTTYNRGYLLCGPTGTGKSSLVAAMANYLKADVYDLDLSQVSSSSQLQTLLMETTNTSILLVEDIVCLPEFMKRSFKQVDETKLPFLENKEGKDSMSRGE
ncbi:hypothetical protein F2Q69_00058408 [Brassica cretica]|uniref:AAA+ ATPase domain-containing protein n=1 Tax=Brassica cretica TaxID=69181 RepID=A0A8S9RAT2_BRACR|nr:hypothetical protein F2Q69_00058408 [Brassica cretica]